MDLKNINTSVILITHFLLRTFHNREQTEILREKKTVNSTHHHQMAFLNRKQSQKTGTYPVSTPTQIFIKYGNKSTYQNFSNKHEYSKV